MINPIYKQLKDVPVSDLNKTKLTELASFLAGEVERQEETKLQETTDFIICGILVDICQQDLSRAQIQNLIESPEVADLFHGVFVEKRDALRANMDIIGWDYPEVVDLNWTVGKVMESPILMNIGKPCATLNFNTTCTDEAKAKNFQFNFDLKKLQDLSWNVKEALQRYEELKKLKPL
ncbi:unnamed protein product [Auanema sp. JU1783]|nr:unnamed protein product [Auanema sp. JU1783]